MNVRMLLNDKTSTTYDLGGVDTRCLPTYAWEAIAVDVMGLADADAVETNRRVQASGTPWKWLEPGAPGRGAGVYDVCFESRVGGRALLIGVPLDRHAFEEAGAAASPFDGSTGRMRFAVANRGLQPRTTAIEFFGPSSVPVKAAGAEIVDILVQRPNVADCNYPFTVDAGDDATRDALFRFAAHLAAGVPDPTHEVLFRTAPGPNHLMAITPHNGAGIAKFTMPALLREHLARG